MVVQMLDTAFYKEILSKPGLSKSRSRARRKNNKTWSYVGRFMWGFTMVEYQVNQLFRELLGPDHGLGSTATVLLTYSLDLRKRSKLIEIILQDRGNRRPERVVHAPHAASLDRARPGRGWWQRAAPITWRLALERSAGRASDSPRPRRCPPGGESRSSRPSAGGAPLD